MSFKRTIDKAIKLMDEVNTKDVMFKPGQVFRNGNGYELKIDSYTAYGKINVKQNGRMFETTEGSLQNIISKNGYVKINDAKVRDAQNRKAFFSKQKQQEFAEYLKRQGAKNIRLSMAADPLNKGGRYYYVDWYMDNARRTK